MNGQTRPHQTNVFLTGLALGSMVGAGVALWLAPKAAAEIKARATGSLRSLGQSATNRYRSAEHRVAQAIDGITRTGQGYRDDMCDSVARAAQDVEHGAQAVQRRAAEAKTSA